MRDVTLLVLFIAVLSLCSIGFSDSDQAKRAIEALSLKDIEITGYRFFGCGRDDFSHTGFTATNDHGNKVSGVVCSGILKGATVRFD